MSFSTYVADHLAQRVRQERAIVVHDPDARYREICESLKKRGITVVDAARSAFELHEEVGKLWMKLTEDPALYVLVYRNVSEPGREDESRNDPLALFDQVMGTFPKPGSGTESYYSLARAAYSDRVDEVDDLFAAEEPSPTILDSLESGDRYPALSAATGASSPTEIIVRILEATTPKLESILGSATARNELDGLLHAALATPKSFLPNGAADASEKLWQYVLFSEFAVDLPKGVPPEFAGVARAPGDKKDFLFRLCNSLRRQSTGYIERAEAVERTLDLSSLVRSIDDFGVIDTFAFENAAALRHTVAALLAGKLEIADTLITNARTSIWFQNDSTLQSTWRVLEEAYGTLDQFAKTLPSQSKTDPVGWYQGAGMKVDKSYRSFVSSYWRLQEEEPYGAPMESVNSLLAERYREWLEQVQHFFVAAIKADGWPLPGLERQDRIFASQVEHHIKGEKRVAYFLVDALRYELADSLADKLKSALRVSEAAAAALLPTKTPLGMAALGPEKDNPLALKISDGDWRVTRGEKVLATAKDRDEWFRAYLGDRCLTETLESWLKRKKSDPPDTKIRLAVIRSTEIDSAGESTDSLFRSSLENLMATIARAVHKAFDYGFDVAVLTADHGFLFIPEHVAGDSVAAPAGNVVIKQDRYAFGRFTDSPAIMVFSEAQLGYSLGGSQLAVPVSTGAFVKSSSYVHGGLSLQEALIPVLTVERAVKPKQVKTTVSLSWRDQKSATVTTLTPSVKLVVSSDGPHLPFEEPSISAYIDIAILVVTETSGKAVGHVGPSEYLDPDSGLLRVRPGTTAPIPLRITEDHRGPCVVKAVDPATDKIYDSIVLDVQITE